jgi:hypothetical protein
LRLNAKAEELAVKPMYHLQKGDNWCAHVLLRFHGEKNHG